jgi:CRP/FNR family transcriptional regulator, anaerobic regulatory protein
MQLRMSYTSFERKIAAFLLDLSEESEARGDSPAEFLLPMKSYEITNHLEIARETVVGTFAKFQQEGLIIRSGMQVRILDMDGLRRRAPPRLVRRQRAS